MQSLAVRPRGFRPIGCLEALTGILQADNVLNEAMELPTLEITPGESVQKAADRLEQECRGRGVVLSGFETLNTVLPTSGYANFFQARIGGAETIFLLMTEEWTNAALVRILNILLEIRADPDPPGSKLRFRIFSAHPVPVLLRTLFGDHRISPIECEAAMVARFGSELTAGDCTRLAAAALHFLRALGRRSDFRDPQGITVVQRTVLDEVRALGLPPEGTPLNLLICLGCLYGELLRSRLPHETEWTVVKEYLPWPCLAIRPLAPAPGHRPGPSTATPHPLGTSPIATTIQLSQGGDPALLEKSARILDERCRNEFGALASETRGRLG